MLLSFVTDYTLIKPKETWRMSTLVRINSAYVVKLKKKIMFQNFDQL